MPGVESRQHSSNYPKVRISRLYCSLPARTAGTQHLGCLLSLAICHLDRGNVHCRFEDVWKLVKVLKETYTDKVGAGLA